MRIAQGHSDSTAPAHSSRQCRWVPGRGAGSASSPLGPGVEARLCEILLDQVRRGALIQKPRCATTSHLTAVPEVVCSQPKPPCPIFWRAWLLLQGIFSACHSRTELWHWVQEPCRFTPQPPAGESDAAQPICIKLAAGQALWPEATLCTSCNEERRIVVILAESRNWRAISHGNYLKHPICSYEIAARWCNKFPQ